MGKEYQDEEEIEIDVLQLVSAVLSHWKMVFAITLLFAGIFFSYCKFLAVPQYESSSKLYVLTKSTSITSLADLQMGSNLTNDYVEVVLGRPVLDQVIANLGLDYEAKDLEEKVDLENPTNSRILVITVTDPSAVEAKRIADEIASVAAEFISQKMDQDPPTVIQSGYADGNPVSPHTKRNTVLGAALGFLLVVFIICISTLMNDTIMTPEDMEKKIGLNVLGSIPLEDSELNSMKKSKKRRKKKKTTSRKKA